MTNLSNSKLETKNQSAQKGSITVMLLACILMAIVLIGGCLISQSNGNPKVTENAENQISPPSVVYINIDRVATALGLIEQASQELQNANSQLQKTREEARTKLQEQVTAAESELGEDSTEEEKQELMNLLQQARTRLNQVDQQLNQIANKNKLTLVNAVRTQIFPSARDIASELGATSLRELEPTVFWYDEEWDISDKVVERMRTEKQEQAKKKPVPTPASPEAPTEASAEEASE